MHLWVNSIVEGELAQSALAPEDLAAAGLGNLLRLHKMAGRDVRPSQKNGEPAFEVRHDDGAIHALHWLSSNDEGASRDDGRGVTQR
jgi:hypothetical protein